jgi:hypothetical protein
MDILSGLTSWNNSMGSHEARVDVELMEDMMIVEMLPGNDDGSQADSVCTRRFM